MEEEDHVDLRNIMAQFEHNTNDLKWMAIVNTERAYTIAWDFSNENICAIIGIDIKIW